MQIYFLFNYESIFQTSATQISFGAILITGEDRDMKKVITYILAVCLIASAVVLPACGAETKADKEESSSAEEAQKSEQKKNEDEGSTEAKPEEEQKEEQEMTTKEALEKVTINTQSSIKIDGSKKVYIDPYKRNEAVHDADLILITHAHYDHFDPPSIRNVAGDKTMIVCPDSMYKDVEGLGVGADLAAVEPGAGISPKSYLEGIEIEAVPAYNLNKNFHPKANGWVGYILTMDGVRYYAAGDTDALPELEDVKCDIAFVPIGGTYTMTAKEAAGLVNSIKPETAVPIHYGTIVGKAQDADVFGDALDKDIEMVKKVEDAK